MDFLSDIELAAPWFLLLLLAVPLLAWLRGARGERPAVVFPSLHLLGRVGKEVRSRAGIPLVALWLLALVFCAAALARPQRVRSHETITASGVEIILAIDVSLSMNIEDFTLDGRTVNRLTAAKKVMHEFIEGRPSDRIGIVAFAGRPYVPSPLTLDQKWLLDSIGRIRIGLVEDGTAIGSAIAASAKRLIQRESESKVVVLLTDGANNSGNLTPETAANLAATLGVKIYAISVGTPGSHRIPLADGSGRVLPGVRQEFDIDTLRAVADITGGKFFQAEKMEKLAEIFRDIDQMEKSEVSRRKIVETDELFHWPAGIGLAAAGVAFVLGQTALRRYP